MSPVPVSEPTKCWNHDEKKDDHHSRHLLLILVPLCAVGVLLYFLFVKRRRATSNIGLTLPDLDGAETVNDVHHDAGDRRQGNGAAPPGIPMTEQNGDVAPVVVKAEPLPIAFDDEEEEDENARLVSSQ